MGCSRLTFLFWLLPGYSERLITVWNVFSHGLLWPLARCLEVLTVVLLVNAGCVWTPYFCLTLRCLEVFLPSFRLSSVLSQRQHGEVLNLAEPVVARLT